MIRARNATSPSDTLRELVAATEELSELSLKLARSREEARQAEMFFEKLYALLVKLEPKEGVRVDRANATFKELALVKAELIEKTETTTTLVSATAEATVQATLPLTSMEVALAGVAAIIVAGALIVLLRRRIKERETTSLKYSSFPHPKHPKSSQEAELMVG